MAPSARFTEDFAYEVLSVADDQKISMGMLTFKNSIPIFCFSYFEQQYYQA